MASDTGKHKRVLGIWSATSIGVGAMIGAGIFALLGIAVEIAGSLAYLSFILAGSIAMLTAYSVSRLAVTFPSKGGPAVYFNQSFGKGVFSGGLNVIMWIGYIIVTALYARAFGEYGIALFNLSEDGFWSHTLSSAIVVIFVLLNFTSAAVVGKSELIIVLVKVLILLSFGLLGITTINLENFTVSRSIGISDILLASGVVFMSFEGFGLIVNTAEDIKNPAKNLPRALYTAVLFVGVIYVLVSIAVIGNLSISQILDSKEYVLAEAAKPIMGPMGFTLIGVAALFSTASAINATIYGPIRMVQETASAGQLPRIFATSVFNTESGFALLFTGFVLLFVVNAFQLREIAETGSLIFLAVYAAINIANFKMYRETASNRWLISLAIAGTLGSFCTFFYYLVSQGNVSSYFFLGIVFLCFIFQWLYQFSRNKRI